MAIHIALFKAACMLTIEVIEDWPAISQSEKSDEVIGARTSLRDASDAIQRGAIARTSLGDDVCQTGGPAAESG